MTGQWQKAVVGSSNSNIKQMLIQLKGGNGALGRKEEMCQMSAQLTTKMHR